MTSLGLMAQLACVWEATARKPGNVHRYADFADTSYLDFVLSAAAVAPVLDAAPGNRVGVTVLEGVRATRRLVRPNTNLGILLLLAPLAAVPPDEELRPGVGRVLANLYVDDARAVYEAIRLAAPGGLGAAPEEDVRGEPTRTLREVMALAADRDRVARQYADDFRDVFDVGVPALAATLARTRALEPAVVGCHLHLLATFPDTLILRKRGPAVADEASTRARAVLAAGWPETEPGRAAVTDLDGWLRAEGNARNPGTTADLVTACLFVALRTGTITLPPTHPWLPGSDDGR
jgi:triphosphoribosyl-dephospho-CoA synthase